MNRDRTGWILAFACALLWFGFGELRFDQGLDLADQGAWVYGASLEASGTAVHSRIDTGDGPLRYELLGAWMRATGEGWHAVATTSAVLHGLIAALLGLWVFRRAGGIAATASLFVLLAAAPLPFGALWAGLTLLIPVSIPKPKAVVAGLLLTGLATVDAALFLTVSLIFSLTFLQQRDRRNGWCAGVGKGLGLGLGLIAVQAVFSHAAAPTLANALRGPWSGDSFSILKIFEVLRSGAWLHLPFAGLGTGESLGAMWPAHGSIRALALRASAATVLASPLLIASRARGWTRPPFALAVAAGVFLLLRGDLPTVMMAMVLTASAWLLEFDRPPGRKIMTATLLVLLVLPLASENLWLATHRDRESLSHWDAPLVNMRLGQRRMRGLQQAVAKLHVHQEHPALIWPDLAGLHFLLQTRPADRTLRPVKSATADLRVAEALSANPAPVVLLAPGRELLPQQLELTMPRTAAALRHGYRLRGSLPAGGLNLRAIEHGGREDDPLVARLPRIECMVAPEVQTLTPALRADLVLGQSFRIEGDDLLGFAVRFVTRADSVDLHLRVRLWDRPGVEWNSLLEARTLHITARRDTPLYWVNFPVKDSAGKDLALVLETVDTPQADVRLAWHELAAEDGIGDVYAGGSALLDLQPVDADLVLLVY